MVTVSQWKTCIFKHSIGQKSLQSQFTLALCRCWPSGTFWKWDAIALEKLFSWKVAECKTPLKSLIQFYRVIYAIVHFHQIADWQNKKRKSNFNALHFPGPCNILKAIFSDRWLLKRKITSSFFIDITIGTITMAISVRVSFLSLSLLSWTLM